MTNHLHMIVSMESNQSIGDVLRDFKKFTSKAIVKAIQDNQTESRKEWLLDRCWFRGTNDSKIIKLQVLARRKLYRNHLFLRIL